MSSSKYDIQKVFNTFKNKDNLIDVQDALISLKALNINLDSEVENDLLDLYKLNLKSNPIKFEMFEKLVNSAMNFFDNSEHNLQLFKLLDNENKGYIDINDLIKIRDKMDPNLINKDNITEQDLLDMLEIADNKQINKNQKSGTFEWLSQSLFGTQDSRKEIKISLRQFCTLMDRIENH